MKMTSYQYRDFLYKDKPVWRPSYLYNVNLHTWKDCLYIVTGPWYLSGSILENRTTQELVVFMAADTKLTIELESYPTLIICPFAVSSKFCWWGGRYRWRHFESASHFFCDNYTQPAIAMITGGNRTKLPSSRWHRRGRSLREVFACSCFFATTNLSQIYNRETRMHGTPCTETTDSYLFSFLYNDPRKIRRETTVGKFVPNNGRR